MMKLLASLFLVAACSHSSPTPVASTTPTAPVPVAACAASGDVLFEIDTNDLAAGPQKEIVFATGAWRLDKAGGGTTSGCLSASDLALVQKDAAVPWTTSAHTGISCHAIHAPTNYLANGKTVYVDSGCDSGVLDDTSANALRDIIKLVRVADRA